MTCWVVVPVKAAEACKTRLRATLTDAARLDLVTRMLRHVVAVAESAAGVDAVLLLGPSQHDLSAGIALLDDPGGGLDAALGSAAREAMAAGIDRLVILPADLPLLARSDVEALIAVKNDIVAVAPDRAGTGTNALSLPGAALARFAFGYGPGSFARHVAEAERLGLGARAIRSPTLALDIDLPADLDALAV